MIDWLVRPEGPLAIGSDRRAAIVARPGGSAANQAVWLAHHGLAVDFVGRVGESDHAEQMAMFRRSGVEPWLIADAERDTGRLVALLDPSGERSFLTDRGANDGLCDEDIPDALLARADHIHLSGYCFVAPSPRRAVRRAMERAGGVPVSVDPASAEFLREMGPGNFLAWTRGAATLFPNAEEAVVLAGTDDPKMQGERLSAHYRLVVIKRGAAGCEAWRGDERWRVAAPHAAAIDTTGAGDAFVAAFLAARLGDLPIEECLARAAAAGAGATEIIGGRPAPNPMTE